MWVSDLAEQSFLSGLLGITLDEILRDSPAVDFPCRCQVRLTSIPSIREFEWRERSKGHSSEAASTTIHHAERFPAAVHTPYIQPSCSQIAAHAVPAMHTFQAISMLSLGLEIEVQEHREQITLFRVD